ncbi:ABC transporter ATP-binding protein [Corynebacterium sp. H78]|uniref:ABC transporter ATP-binding protein n=1 Tax=Corynebacterium sp. H78 TaxID=3133417 RepID=UPI0030A4E193
MTAAQPTPTGQSGESDRSTPAIRFEGVSKTYGAGPVVVESVDVDIPRNAVTVFVGSSGCGKTTLLRMVNRMVQPTSGRVLIDGEDIAGHDPVKLRRGIGYVMQNGGLLPHRTVVDNVATVPRLNGWSRRKARDRAMELLEVVGLDPAVAKRYPAQLSGGQQQRVGVARALAAESGILLMDEPFAAVDPIVRRELQAEVKRLQRELGRTVLFVTHDIGEAFHLGDKVVLLSEGGRIAQQGPPNEFIENPANEFVRDFIDADSRQLHIDGSRVLDARGRVAGVLASPQSAVPQLNDDSDPTAPSTARGVSS